MSADRVSDELAAKLQRFYGDLTPGRLELLDVDGLAFAITATVQHLRSPVTVSDEMVETAHRAQMSELFLRCQPDRGEVFGFMDDRKDVMRAALTAALVPDEQEGEKVGQFVSKPNPFQSLEDALYAEGEALEAPTPGGDNRVVAWLHTLHMEADQKSVTADLEEEHPYGQSGEDFDPSYRVTSEPLVPLSSLKAVERERDNLKVRLGIMTGAASRFEERANRAIARAETAEASLAAAQSDFEQRILSSLSPPTGTGEPLAFGYTNWRGEYAERTAIPLRIERKESEWHGPGLHYVMVAFDVEKQAERDFLLTDMGRPPSPPEAE